MAYKTSERSQATKKSIHYPPVYIPICFFPARPKILSQQCFSTLVSQGMITAPDEKSHGCTYKPRKIPYATLITMILQQAKLHGQAELMAQE